MHLPREPRLHPVPIPELRPTQMTVGLREVRAKRDSWRSIRHRARFLGSHLVPVVHGPKDRFWLVDHHHLVRALHDEGVRVVAVTVIADLRALDRESFFTYLDNRGWMHPYDARGRRRTPRDLPASVEGLEDDPFRSLAGELRRAGGFAKDTTPFSEFLWADFLRRRIDRKRVEKRFASALEHALELARGPDSAYLPGWCGPAHER
jgi:hypothetical protein